MMKYMKKGRVAALLFMKQMRDEMNGLKIHRRYSDNYRDVLDGKIFYNEKGQREIYKENGELWYVLDY